MFEQRVTDLSYLQKIFKGDILLVREMILLFLRDTPETISAIKEYIEQENWTGVAAAVHKMKPSVAYMGLNSTRSLLKALENNARNPAEQNQSKALLQANEFERICNQAYAELHEALEELKGK